MEVCSGEYLDNKLTFDPEMFYELMKALVVKFFRTTMIMTKIVGKKS